MLRQGQDGFTVDFSSLEGKKEVSGDEQLLLKLRAALETPAAPEGAMHTLDLAASQGARLAATLARLETLQPWPQDVLELSHNLRARLSTLT